MQALTLSLAIVCLGLFVHLFLLWPLFHSMRVKKQAYTFHAIRDRLQLHAVDGDIDRDSVTYQFLIWFTNLSIRNSGTMKFRDLVKFASQIEETVEGTVNGTTDLFADIQSQSKEVRQLAAECFMAFGYSLIRNDWLVYNLINGRRLVVRCGVILNPVVKIVDYLASAMVRRSTRAQAVVSARKYIRWGKQLQPV